jgi:lysophospholipase L1-like esterase
VDNEFAGIMMASPKHKNIIFGAITAVLSVVVSLVLAEVTLRLFLPQDLSGTWRVDAPMGGYRLNKSDGSARHQFKDRAVKYSFFPPHLRDTPLIDDDRLRVLFLGDSFTFGWLLNFDDSYVGQLIKLSNDRFGHRFQFLNAAAGDWGTADYVAFVEDFAAVIRPSVVVVFLNTDDIGRSFQRKLYSMPDPDSLALNRVQEPDRPSMAKKIINAVPFYEVLLEHSHLVQFLRNLTVERRFRNDAKIRDSVPIPNSAHLSIPGVDSQRMGKALFLRLARLCERYNARLLVLTTGWFGTGSETIDGDPTVAFLQAAPEFFERVSVPFVDLTSAVSQKMGKDRRPFVIEGDVHPNELGAALIARSAWPFLQSELSAVEGSTRP